MFEIWDVHGRAVPYTLRPPKQPGGLAVAQPAAGVKPAAEQAEPATRRAMAAYTEGAAPDAHRRAPLAGDWMTRPVVTVSAQAALVDVWTLFRARQFRHVPVVEAGDPAGLRPPVGMLSDRDLLLYFADHDGTAAADLPDVLVQDVMKTDILTARPGTSIRRVAHVMVREKLGAIPIVDPSEGLVGVLTRSDIMRLAVELTTTDLPAL